MLRFNFSTYEIGTLATPTHFFVDEKEIADPHAFQRKYPHVPLYALEWTMMSHTPGDMLLSVQLLPHGDPTTVVRYQVIVS